MSVQLATVFGKILLMMALGFGLEKRGVMKQDMKEQLAVFLVKVVLPINIISSAGKAFSSAQAFGMLQVVSIASLYYLIALGALSFLTRRMKSRPGHRSVFINLAVFANVGFIGFPVLGELLGATGTLFTVAFNVSFQLFFYSYGVFLLRDSGKLTLKALFASVNIYASIFAVILYVSGLRFPVFVQSTLDAVGGMMSPISMIVIGWEIANTETLKILRDKHAYLISGIRLILVPLIMAAIMKLLNVTSEVATAVVLLSALPSGSMTVIMSHGTSSDTPFAARGVAQSTLLMLLTLPFVSILATQLFR